MYVAMKRIIIILSLFILSALCALSCNKSEMIGKLSPTEYYIQSYLEAGEVKVSNTGYHLLLKLQFVGKKYLPYKDERGDRFREIGAFYGDTYYNKPSYPGGPTALCNELTSIELVSNCDFNGRPPGTSLGDVVDLIASSAIPFLESGYEDWFDWSDTEYKGNYLPRGLTGFHSVSGPLSELDPAELRLLLAYDVFLKFLEVPDIKRHTFTITVTDTKRTMSHQFKNAF